MRDIYDLPLFAFDAQLQAVTCAEMDWWCDVHGRPLLDGWLSTKRRRSSAGMRLLGSPFIVIDLPPDPTARKVFTPADPAEVWF